MSDLEEDTSITKFVSFESIGHGESLSCSDSIKINLYFAVIDIMSKLNRHFSTCNLDLMKSLDAWLFFAYFFSFLLWEFNDRQFNTECIIAKGSLSTDGEPSIEKIYFQLLSLLTAFPTLTTLFKIALSIVVSTAQCERSFSAMTRIKTHLRTTMLDQRLADISLLSLERDLTTSTNFIEDTIKDFEGMDKNRTIVLS